jgi:peptidoglycan/xylan/chitin deacetylase (PgdA/CDA1 family)
MPSWINADAKPRQGDDMIGKKAWLGGVWGDCGIAAASLHAGLAANSHLLILAYHRVLDVPDEDAFAGDPELVSASREEFERQMRFVQRHFMPIRFADVLRALDEGKRLPRRSLIVTFDDGHVDNYTHAYPVLKSLGVPATIFLSTQYIDQPHLPFWFDRVSQLLYFAPSGLVEIALLDHRAELSDIASRRLHTRLVLCKLKAQDNDHRLAALAQMEARLASNVPEAVAAQRSAMNWDEVREMAACGIEFGSHTVTHPVLTRLDDAALVRELADSRAAIRSHIAQPVDIIAYPVGKMSAFSSRIEKAASACGYRLGVSYETGTNRACGGVHQFALRRLAVERYVSFGHFKSMLSLPRVFA